MHIALLQLSKHIKLTKSHYLSTFWAFRFENNNNNYLRCVFYNYILDYTFIIVASIQKIVQKS